MSQMNNLKITIIWESQVWGGVDNYLLYLLQNWPNKKDKFTIIANSKSKGLENFKSMISDQIEIKYFYIDHILNIEVNKFYTDILNIFFTPLNFIINYFRFRRLYRKINLKSDIFIGQCGGYPGTFFVQTALIASYNLDIKFKSMVTHHAPKKPRLFLQNFSKLVDRLLAKKLNSIIFVSDSTRFHTEFKTYLLENENDIHPVVIRNGIEIKNIDEASLSNCDNRLAIDTTKINFGILGRIEKEKGHEDLIMGIHELQDSTKKKIKLHVIGKGSHQIELKLLVKKLNLEEVVSFTGYIKGNSVDIIRELDVIVSASRNFEGFGLSIEEALLMKKPFISTDVGALKYFKNDSFGIVIKPGHGEYFKNAIIKMIKNLNIYRNNLEIRDTDNYTAKKMSELYYTHFTSKLILKKQ